MNPLPRHRCLSQGAQRRCRDFQTALVRLLFLGLALTLGPLRGYAQTITNFTAESTVVNGSRQYVGHITLSSLHYVYVSGNGFGLSPGGHWVPAPTIVTLSSADPATVQTPSQVTVGPNSLTVSFPITIRPVAVDTVIGITATCLKSSLTANLVVRAPELAGLWYPHIFAFNTTGSMFLRLDSPAPASGVTVTIHSPASTFLSAPASVTIPAGSTGVSVPFRIGPGMYLTISGLSATLGGVTLNAEFLVELIRPFDFNNDGQNDLLVQNSATGDVGVWLLNGDTLIGGSFFHVHPGAEWTLTGSAEAASQYQSFPDRALVFQNSTDGRVIFVYTDGSNLLTTQAASVVPAPGYKIVGIGEFNGDRFDDLVFQDQNTHEIVIWMMGIGSLVSEGVRLPIVPAAGWNVVGVGDFNQDGQPDLLFQNAVTGQLVVWYMSGTSIIGSDVLPTIPPAGWQVKAVADYNNDGIPDIVFQTGLNSPPAIWSMNGLSVEGSTLLSAPLSAPYRIAGPH